jgi:hypothetical protein
MTTSTYSPLLQAPYGQTSLYGQQSPYGAPGVDQSTPFQQSSPWTQYGPQSVEQIMPTIQLITHQLANAQQCVWTAQYLFAQVVPQIAQIQQPQTLPFGQFGQFGQYGQPFGPFGQRPLPRQYQMAW